MGETIKQRALNYFESFSEKNITKISEAFSEDISLQDWDITALGRVDVLAATEKIFDSVRSIKVMPIRLLCEDTTVVAELEITIDSQIKLFVVDVLDFNTSGLITRIRAYKG